MAITFGTGSQELKLVYTVPGMTLAAISPHWLLSHASCKYKASCMDHLLTNSDIAFS